MKVNIQKIANSFARKNGFGRATKIVLSDNVDELTILKASTFGWKTRGGAPIRHRSAYAKKGFSNMVYSHAFCEVAIPTKEFIIK